MQGLTPAKPGGRGGAGSGRALAGACQACPAESCGLWTAAEASDKAAKLPPHHTAQPFFPSACPAPAEVPTGWTPASQRTGSQVPQCTVAQNRWTGAGRGLQRKIGMGETGACFYQHKEYWRLPQETKNRGGP